MTQIKQIQNKKASPKSKETLGDLGGPSVKNALTAWETEKVHANMHRRAPLPQGPPLGPSGA